MNVSKLIQYQYQAGTQYNTQQVCEKGNISTTPAIVTCLEWVSELITAIKKKSDTQF
jgi:hypothetical protein